jgi:hypothetical protein
MKPTNNFYIEIECHQENKNGNLVCGDVFLSRKIKEENKAIAILSDGLGSGVKANVLATMTASMALNFTSINTPVVRTAKSIMNTLPMDAQRQINYSTFTILNIDNDGETKIVEYDNPPFILIRGGKICPVEPRHIKIDSNIRQNQLCEYHFFACKEDRIIIVSDGITQAGIGSAMHPFGWGDENLAEFVCQLIRQNPTVSANDLSKLVLEKARMLDGLKLKDDASCSVVYFRAPRRMLICSGPPYHRESDKTLATLFQNFDGDKVICGGTTAQILARELNEDIAIDLGASISDLPPASKMKSANLVTEGILTLGKVAEILRGDADLNNPRNGVANEMARMFMEHDSIRFLVGTKVNQAHQDPSLPIELEIRRSVIKRVARLLEEKYRKEVQIDYI